MAEAIRQVTQADARDATFVHPCFVPTAAVSAWAETLSVAADPQLNVIKEIENGTRSFR